VKELTERGAHVILTARDVKRGEAAAQAIREAHPDASIEVMQLDLASLASVRRFAEMYKAQALPLHVLINNAGALGLGKQIQFTQDGFELEFGINHLGHFLLTNLLLPVLKASAPSRVITVSSIRHIPGKGGKGARFDFDNLKGEKGHDPGITYNNTKLANVTNIHWHDFRRTFAGALLDVGEDISTVAKLMGHASVTTTARYDKRDAATQRRAAKKISVPYF